MDLRTPVFEGAAVSAVVENLVPLCELAQRFEEAGEFEQAAETLSPFWTGLVNRPETKGLEPRAKAELLLRSGTLTGWLGSAKQV
jgi:hypothetical protein